MNKKYIYPIIGFTTIMSAIGIHELKSYSLDMPSLLTFKNLDSVKILDMDFNNNAITNKVTNKNYSTANGTGKIVSSIKGNGFEFNNDYITIPKTQLDIKDTDNVMTVSFLYKFDGTDPDGYGYIVSFGGYNLSINSNNIGFNTMQGDVFGTKHGFEKGKTYHVTAEFNKGNVGANKIYINGVSKSLTNLVSGNTYNNSNAVFNNDLSIGTITINQTNPNYKINEPSVIDEIKIYKKALTQTEVTNVANAHKIPELRSEIVNNSYPKLTWATEMLPENILYQFGFEETEQKGINLVYNSGNQYGTGGQTFSTTEKFTGKYSLMTPTTIPGKGNMVNAPYVATSNNNALYYTSLKLGLDRGIPVSATYRAKTKGNGSSIRLYGDWTYDSEFVYYNSYTLEDYPAGTQYIKISNPHIFPLSTKGYSHVTLDSDPFVHLTNGTGAITDMENGIMKLSTPLKEDVPKGTQLRSRKMVHMFQFPTLNIIGDNNWNLYNTNSYVANTVDIDWHKKPQMLRQSWVAGNDLYIDDVIVGHATKIRLYRDGSKIYEGYEAQYDDTSSKDKAKPNKVTNINANMTMINPATSQRKIKIDFKAPADNGTTYNYQISAVSKEGVETPKSNTLSQNVTSGIKGYSYVIDKNPTTVPNNTVNLTTTNIETNITDSGVYYLHIKAIDNAGNVGDVVHHKIDIPTITSQAKPSEDKIRLDWTMNNLNENTFKVYKRSDSQTEFQSISATSLENGKKVKVLLAYPEGTCSMDGTKQPMTSYVDKNGETITIPLSASLKKWMEEPKPNYPKGYGMGAIEIDIVSIREFNANANGKLKNNDGTWKYDVFVLGVADCNGSREAIDDNSTAVLSEFIESGRGVFFGHDTVYDDARTPNALLAKKYMNMTVNTDKKTSFRDSKVVITRKGLLTSFPHKIGDVGTILNVPLSHTSHQIPNSINDNWLIYANGSKDHIQNFYLTTYNNFAMSQTGHSTGEATEDEQKILANTLFYLNQLSTDNYLDDNSGQDVKAPNKVTGITNKFSNGVINFTFPQVTDNGSTYEYYVEAENKNGERKTVSNVTKSTITSGVKGYSYVIDSNPTTIPDNIVDTTSNTIKANVISNNLYLHVKAIDNVGNASETTHYQVTDTTAPTMTISGNPNNWTNQNVTLSVTGSDVGTGVKHIVLPNGNIVSGSTANYMVSDNGNYTFKIVDNMGNTTTQTVNVSKIDKTINNIMNINQSMSMIDTTNSTRRMTFTFNPITDNQSGLKGYSYVIDKNPNTIPDNTVNTVGTTITRNVSDTGVYYLHIKGIDNAGNTTNVIHHKVDVPKLTAQAKPTEDKIRLDWTMGDTSNKTFKVYQKKPGSTEFQSISMTNFDNNKPVRALNIFPTYDIGEVEDNRVDLAGQKLHKSALLEEWISDYGMGKVEVDSLNKEDFEANPDKWLKNKDGSYKYDVIVVGFWNISYAEQHINNTGVEAIRRFINDGGGVLTGHHHLGLWELDKGMNLLKQEFGIKIVVEKDWSLRDNLTNLQQSMIDYEIPTSTSSDRWSGRYWHSNTQVKAEKKGLLLNYPHNVSEEGRIFNMPFSHNTNDFVTGDVWLSYIPSNGYNANKNEPVKNITQLPDGTTGTKNSYLSTYNNTALIQTGHSSLDNGTLVATEDEKKVLANTIFYLNQKSTDNFLDDNSGQDVTAPNTPVIYEHNFVNNNNIELNFREVQDNGSTYEYYVESQTKDNDSLTLSDVKKATITSGLKGYSYIVDNNPNTIPDDIIEQTTNETIRVNINENTKYVHIKAIDNAGNSSETYHYKITDTIAPTMTITGNPTSWTNKNITLNITADDKDSGINYIELPNGNRVRAKSATYSITQNGNYTFKAVDYMGNITTQTIVVTKIDKTLPILTANKTINSTKTQATITVNVNDTLSGLDYLELPDGAKIKNINSYTFTATNNGLYPFIAYDNAGNKSLLTVEVNELNTYVAPSEIGRIEYKLSGATTKDWTTYTGAFYITNEGITTITARSYDKAGNVSDEKTSTVKIDKTKPANNSILIELK